MEILKLQVEHLVPKIWRGKGFEFFLHQHNFKNEASSLNKKFTKPVLPRCGSKSPGEWLHHFGLMSAGIFESAVLLINLCHVHSNAPVSLLNLKNGFHFGTAKSSGKL